MSKNCQVLWLDRGLGGFEGGICRARVELKLPPKYEDVPGFCKSTTTAEIAALNYVVTPGRYVGLPDDEDDFDFKERFSTLRELLMEQIQEENELNKRIEKNLEKIKFE